MDSATPGACETYETDKHGGEKIRERVRPTSDPRGRGRYLIVPTAFAADTIRPEMPAPSFPEDENSPWLTGTGTGNVNVPNVPHETVVSTSF